MSYDIKTNPNISPCSIFLPHSHKFCGYEPLPFCFHIMKTIACQFEATSDSQRQSFCEAV